VSWNAAKSACEALGSTLAMIKTQAEQQALAPKITPRTWIGLHRDPKAKSRWLWIDGTQASYTYWNKGEPNSIAEECGEIWPPPYNKYWKWNDQGCSSALHYVCEIKGWSKLHHANGSDFTYIRKSIKTKKRIT